MVWRIDWRNPQAGGGGVSVSLFPLLYFALLQPWGGFPDPDAFYHAKIADLIARFGPLASFPWLDLTSLGPHFADQHFLFHLFLIPAEKLFGVLFGSQIAAVLFAASFSLVFFLLLRSLKIRAPFLWFFLLLFCAPFAVRLSLAKATPFALMAFCLGLGAILLKRPWLAFFVGFLFVLSHGGWPLVFLASLFLFAGMFLFERLVEGRSFRDWSWSSLQSIGFFVLGTLVGIAMHPNAQELFSFLWVQIVKIGVAAPAEHVLLGQEWSPLSLSRLFLSFMPLWIATCAVFAALRLYPARPLDLARAKQAIGLGCVMALTVALTLKSQRFVEYLAPVWVLWLGLLWSLVDGEVFVAAVVSAWKRLLAFVSARMQRAVLVLLAGLGCSLFLHEFFVAYTFLHARARPFDRFQDVVAAISSMARPRDRVFNANWDEFPELFYHEDGPAYVSGIDPTFLYEADPGLSDLYNQIITGKADADLYQAIRERFGARFVFLEPRRQTALAERLDADPHFIILRQSEAARVYLIRDVVF